MEKMNKKNLSRIAKAVKLDGKKYWSTKLVKNKQLALIDLKVECSIPWCEFNQHEALGHLNDLLK